MVEDIQRTTGSIVLFNGSPLERIAVTALIPHDKLVDLLHSRFFIPNEVVIGEYGVAGFVVIDTRPEERWESYTDSELHFISHSLEEHCIHLSPQAKESPIRLAHYVNTDKGFKMIRYFILPIKVHDFFRSDEDIGEGLIAKCCKSDFPKWFDEENAHDVFGGYANKEGDRLIDFTKESTAEMLGVIAEPDRFGYRFRDEHYLSFHPWQFFTHVVQVGEDSIVKAIGTFDSMLNTLDRSGKLHKRDISTKGATEYVPALPQHVPYPPPLST